MSELLDKFADIYKNKYGSEKTYCDNYTLKYFNIHGQHKLSELDVALSYDIIKGYSEKWDENDFLEGGVYWLICTKIRLIALDTFIGKMLGNPNPAEDEFTARVHPENELEVIRGEEGLTVKQKLVLDANNLTLDYIFCEFYLPTFYFASASDFRSGININHKYDDVLKYEMKIKFYNAYETKTTPAWSAFLNNPKELMEKIKKGIKATTDSVI